MNRFDKIVCVGKNYAEHAKEMRALSGDAIPDRPVLFIKPPSALREARGAGDRLELSIPSDAGELHHECEIVLKLGKGGYRLSIEEGRAAIAEVTLGLDMTLRDRQTRLKKLGHPWEIGKVFPDAAVVGPWVPVREFEGFLDERFTLKLDGEVRQSGFGREMTLRPAECVAYMSEHFRLCEGDLIFTGTPTGVGPVREGQVAELEWGPIRYSTVWRAEKRS